MIISILYETSTTGLTKEDMGIINLSNDLKLDEYNNIVILFYFPWDVSYQMFIPEYIEAAFYFRTFQPTNITFAKVDCSIDNKIADLFEITSYPALIFLKGADQYNYKKVLKSEALIYFLSKKLNGPILTFNSPKEINEFIPWNSHIMINLMPKTNDSLYENGLFQKFASSKETIPIYFLQCDTPACLSHYKYSKIAYIRNLDDDIATNYYNSTVSTASISNLIWKYSLKPCAPITSLAVEIIFSFPNRTSIIYFRDNSNLTQTSKDYLIQTFTRGHLHKLSSYTVSPRFNMLHDSILYFFGISPNTVPQLIIVQVNMTGFSHYSMKIDSCNDISIESLGNFYNDYDKGKLKPKLKSEPIPHDPKPYTPIKVVGQTYHAVVNQRTQPILLLFYETECKICNRLLQIWQDLAKSFSHINFAYLDLSLNEIKGVKISSLPKIYFYSKNVTESPIKYTGQLDYLSIDKWLMSQVHTRKIKIKTTKIAIIDEL